MPARGRDVTFDTQNDPSVRIEAARVRPELEWYYLAGSGYHHYPKGRYVPRFEINELEQLAGLSEKAMVDVREPVATSPKEASREERPAPRGPDLARSKRRGDAATDYRAGSIAIVISIGLSEATITGPADRIIFFLAEAEPT